MLIIQRNFGKTKLICGSKNTSSFPSCINMDSTSTSDKEQMLNCFNKHFVASGFLFDSQNLACCDSDFTNAEICLSKDKFRFQQIKNSDVYKALKLLDTNKSPGPDCVESVYLKLATDFITSTLTYIFNLSLITGVIPEICFFCFTFY